MGTYSVAATERTEKTSTRMSAAPIGRCKAKNALQGAVAALHAPFTSLSESWLRQISR